MALRLNGSSCNQSLYFQWDTMAPQFNFGHFETTSSYLLFIRQALRLTRCPGQRQRLTLLTVGFFAPEFCVTGMLTLGCRGGTGHVNLESDPERFAQASSWNNRRPWIPNITLSPFQIGFTQVSQSNGKSSQEVKMSKSR